VGVVQTLEKQMKPTTLHKRRLSEHAAFMRQLAEMGMNEKHPERIALALLLESQARTEARLNDFIDRIEARLSQQLGK
jgi:nuclear transport factor 2 (NTF2) superfamily protein